MNAKQIDEKQKTGAIAFIVLLGILGFCFVYTSVKTDKLVIDVLSDFLKESPSMMLYAAIPCAIALILRAKFGVRSLKWIALAATVFTVLLFMISINLTANILYETVLVYEEAGLEIYDYVNEWIAVFIRFALNFSMPVLYCVAFAGGLYRLPFVKKTALIVFAPSVLYLLSLLIRRILDNDNGLIEIFNFINEHDTLKIILNSILCVVWALLAMFISHVIYGELKKHDRLKKILTRFAPATLAIVSVAAAAFAVVPMLRPDEAEFVKTYNENLGIYEFAYAKSELHISKEIFDEYGLTDEHVRKFFDAAELVYKKLTGFFPRYNFPKVVFYRAVPAQWRPELAELGYEYYEDKINLGSWHDIWTNETFYEENLFAQHLSMIDAGFPAVVCREVSYFITMYAERRYTEHYTRPYVWDAELFAVLAEYYIASEIPVVNADGEIVGNSGEWDDPDYGEILGFADKYGYKLISDVLKRVNNASPDLDSNANHPKTLFVKFLSQKTGDVIELQ